MKKLYAHFLFSSLLLVSIFNSQKTIAQCPNGGEPGTRAFDTTIRFATGITNKKVKFPKFNPSTGMVSCVRLAVTIIGIVDTVAMQNYSGSAQTATLSYDRTDNMSGPGLAPSISNSYDGDFGPYNLAAYDGTPNAGPDFLSRPRDTVLKKVMTRTINQADEISNFYGLDSVEYDYNINVSTSAAMTGGSSSNFVLTSALVNFRFEYCTCSMQVLPVGPGNFRLNKGANNTAELLWDGEAADEHFYYEVEASRDGRYFKRVGKVDKKATSNSPSYRYVHNIKGSDLGRYFYRVKQRWTNGYFRYSDVKSIEVTNTLFSNVSIYPNPTSGTAGIKFVAARAGVYSVQISNAAGQVVVRKEVRVGETDYKALPSLQKGTYYVRITEQESQASTIQQLIIH